MEVNRIFQLYKNFLLPSQIQECTGTIIGKSSELILFNLPFIKMRIFITSVLVDNAIIIIFQQHTFQ